MHKWCKVWMIEETAFCGLSPAPNNPNYLSLSLKVRRSSPLNISCGLLWTHSDRSVSFMHRRSHSWRQHCKWGLTLVKQRGRFTLLPMLLGISPAHGWLSGLQSHIANSCPIFHLPGPWSPSLEGCSQSTHPSACAGAVDWTETGAALCTWPCWTPWCLHKPIPSAYQGHPGQHLSLLPISCPTEPGVSCKPAKGMLSPTEDIKQHSPRCGPLRATTAFHLETEPFALSLCMQLSRQFFIHLNSPSGKLISLLSSSYNVLGNHNNSRPRRR